MGLEAGQWYVVLRRSSRQEAVGSFGPTQVDTLYADWRGQGKPSLVLTGHTPVDRVKTRLFLLSVDLDDNGVYDFQVEMTPPIPPASLFWTVSYQYHDAAHREASSDLLSRWRGKLASQMLRDFYEAEYFFNHGPEFAASQRPEGCP